MKRHIGIALCLLLGGTAIAAERGPDGMERHGRQLFVQSCGICHLKPNLVSERYGPALSRATVEGREAAARGLIEGGSARMPGFRYELSSVEIDAIIAYLMTVPAPASPP